MIKVIKNFIERLLVTISIIKQKKKEYEYKPVLKINRTVYPEEKLDFNTWSRTIPFSK